MLGSSEAAAAGNLEYVSFALLDHFCISSQVFCSIGRCDSQLLLQSPLALALLHNQATLSWGSLDETSTPLQLERRWLRWALNAASLLSLLLLFWRHGGLLGEPWLLATLQI